MIIKLVSIAAYVMYTAQCAHCIQHNVHSWVVQTLMTAHNRPYTCTVYTLQEAISFLQPYLASKTGNLIRVKQHFLVIVGRSF